MLTQLRTTPKLVKAVFAAAVLLGLAGAANAAELKVATFDAQDVLNGTNAAKRAEQALVAKRDAAQAKINGMEKPLIEKQKKLQEQKAVLTADKFQAAQAEFQKEVAKFRTDAQGVQSELNGEITKYRKQISDTVRGVVDALAKEKGYDLVLPKGMVYFASANVTDISAEVLARANKLLDK